MNRILYHASFFAGLAVLCWVSAGYAHSNPLALVMTVLVGVFYLMGAVELHRFKQATSTLTGALAGMPETLPSLGSWLSQLHPSLQNAVRLRIEGERVGLPGPTMTPYLAGFLVLLGMLGTFLGMVVTLNGTGTALETATDLQAIRSSLSAPVKGLGLAFGTSVAGVAASAMLGLMSALSRQQRLQAAQTLDTAIATTLRAFSVNHQREASFALMQRQADAMPELIDLLRTMTATMERQGQTLNERLIASQENFHGKAEAAYAQLAASVDQSLKTSLTEGARVAGATIQPVVEATMAGIARETASLRETVSLGVQRQLDELSARLQTATTTMADTWQVALTEHRRTSDGVSENLRASLARFSETFEQRSASLVNALSERVGSTLTGVSDTWRDALAQQAQVNETLSTQAHQAFTAAATTFDQRAISLLSNLDQAHAGLRAELASGDQQRLAAWVQALESMAASLQQQWQQAGAQALAHQQQICVTLEQTARGIATQAEAHASGTIAEIARLVQAASEAPRAAAEVIAELRQRLSDSMVRDNDMLEERQRILQTLGTLLDAVNHASTEQRAAIDALVATSADLLERAGSRFTEKIDAESANMAVAAAQVTGSAAEVASLSEAMGFAVQLFSQSNDKLMAHLQRIEGALSKSITRSDEQLAYYVAQAREVIDLSIMSQKQIVEDLQQLGSNQARAGIEA